MNNSSDKLQSTRQPRQRQWRRGCFALVQWSIDIEGQTFAYFRKTSPTLFRNLHHKGGAFLEIICAHEPTTLNHSILQSPLSGLSVMLLSLAAGGQESSSTPVPIEAPHVEGTSRVPSFRVAHFRVETLDEDNF